MFSKRIYVCVIGIAFILSAYSATGQAPNPVSPGQRAGAGRGGRGANDPWPGKKKLLLIADVQTGYHHDSLNHAMATVERLGRESGAYVTVIRTDSQLITKQPIPGQ